MKRLLTAFLLTILLFDIGTSLNETRNDTHQVIFGGQFATIYEAPYHVYLQFNGQYICGGSLITLRHVITAAHCITPKAQNPYLPLVVIAGTDSQYKRGFARNARNIFIHPRYGGYEWSFDIGVILLSAPFEKSNAVSTIPLPTQPLKIGERVTITGFGRYSQFTPDTSMKLKKLVSQVIDCRRWLDGQFIKGGDICVRSARGQGICSGDSGSPLISDKGEIVGVASRVFDCADGTPDIYSYVYFYLKYINTIVQRTSPQNEPSSNNHPGSGNNGQHRPPGSYPNNNRPPGNYWNGWNDRPGHQWNGWYRAPNNPQEDNQRQPESRRGDSGSWPGYDWEGWNQQSEDYWDGGNFYEEGNWGAEQWQGSNESSIEGKNNDANIYAEEDHQRGADMWIPNNGWIDIANQEKFREMMRSIEQNINIASGKRS